jgi:hypothetical protein
MLHWLLGEDTLARQNAEMAIAAGDADPALAAICRSTRQAETDGPSGPSQRPLTPPGNPINYRSVANASQ